jgi:hypothetical protein
MIKVKYTEALNKAAEEYLIKLFNDKKCGSDANSNVITAAMVILQGVGWHQDKIIQDQILYEIDQIESLDIEDKNDILES